MEITFLGTAASEGYPNPFCACANCAAARTHGGRSVRLRSAALIDDELLIDLGPDLVAAAHQQGRSLAAIRYALQTHEHADHLDPSLLYARSADCDAVTGRLDYYATQGALDLAAARIGGLPPAGLLDAATAARFNLRPVVIEPFQTFAAGPYLIGTVAAAHDPSLTALLFTIRRDGRSLFYGTDTGPLPAASWDFLKQGGWRFNVVVLDHTFGLGRADRGHLNAAQFVDEMARFRVEELVTADARFIAHHLAHHGNPPHPELVEVAAGHGYEVAYDGLRLAV